MALHGENYRLGAESPAGPTVGRRQFLTYLGIGGSVAWAYPVLGPLTGKARAASAPDSFPFDRSGAVAYAERWWNSRNDTYNSFGNDCTNYVSQCWHDGGLYPFRFDGPRWYHKKPRFWFFETQEWTHSWTVTREFATAMVVDFRVAEFTYADISSSWNSALPGDAIQYNWGTGDGFSHGSVEVGYGNFTYNGQPYNGDYMNQHTTDRRHAPWNWGWLQENDPLVRSNMRARVVHFIDRSDPPSC